jgi:murein L,D-transpeptidase YcbB/YkuD
VRQVYDDRDYRPLWTSGGWPLDRAGDLLSTLCRAEREGLRRADYGLLGLRRAIERLRDKENAGPEDLAALDLRLTVLFLAYGADLLAGRLDPRAVDDGWYVRARRSSIDSTLRVALQKDRFRDMIGPLRPRQREYRELEEALASYREILDQGGWPVVPTGRALRLGDSGSSVASLRDRLRVTDDLSASDRAKPVFDDEVAAAVARFQTRHGLVADSSVDEATLGALNVPVETRIRQLELNLDRYRWLPAEFEDRYILVNIPDYHLYAYDRGKEVLDQRVIVGDEYRNATPVFADSMTYLVFRPHWNVPSRILVDEMIPKVQENSSYLAEHNYEVVDVEADSVVHDPASIDWSDVDTADLRFRVRQKAGARNSLGLVKFMFPNRFNIYLHDTPARELFQTPTRTLSHGCVRVEDPVALAKYALAGQDGWNEEKIREAMASEDSANKHAAGRTVPLERPVPVYLLYLTAFVREGLLNFRDDPYGKDRQAMARLGKPQLGEPALCKELLKLLRG